MSGVHSTGGACTPVTFRDGRKAGKRRSARWIATAPAREYALAAKAYADFVPGLLLGLLFLMENLRPLANVWDAVPIWLRRNADIKTENPSSLASPLSSALDTSSLVQIVSGRGSPLKE